MTEAKLAQVKKAITDGKLVQAAVDEITARGGEVRATCSYAAKWLTTHRK